MARSSQPEPPHPHRGLRQRELCEYLGMNYREVARTARELGLSTHVCVQQQTGWILREELYYPPENTTSEDAASEETTF
ncbi:MAG: hypothetical protein AAGA60_18855 [Cyanobacteria bacterium P01_E01_bin.42]